MDTFEAATKPCSSSQRSSLEFIGRAHPFPSLFQSCAILDESKTNTYQRHVRTCGPTRQPFLDARWHFRAKTFRIAWGPIDGRTSVPEEGDLSVGRMRSASRLVDDGMFRKKAGKQLATAASARNAGSRHPKLRLRDRHQSTHTFPHTCPHVFVWFSPCGLHEKERRHLVRAATCSVTTVEPAIVASVFLFLPVVCTSRIHRTSTSSRRGPLQHVHGLGILRLVVHPIPSVRAPVSRTVHVPRTVPDRVRLSFPPSPLPAVARGRRPLDPRVHPPRIFRRFPHPRVHLGGDTGSLRIGRRPGAARGRGAVESVVVWERLVEGVVQSVDGVGGNETRVLVNEASMLAAYLLGGRTHHPNLDDLAADVQPIRVPGMRLQRTMTTKQHVFVRRISKPPRDRWMMDSQTSTKLTCAGGGTVRRSRRRLLNQEDAPSRSAMAAVASHSRTDRKPLAMCTSYQKM